MTNPAKRATGIRALNDGDRTPEFKSARGDLIAAVNGWLKTVADKRNAGKRLGDEPILASPRIQQTDLGATGPRTHLMVEEFERGVSLTGDGVGSALLLQSVTEGSRRGSVDVVVVQGVDPISDAVNGDTFGSDRSLETVAGFEQREVLPEGTDSYYKILVRGDGRVEHRHVSPNGTHTGKTLTTPAELRSAKQAFEQMARNVGLGARGLG